MNKQPSLSKLSSRSLSKLKNKIDVAFSRQSNNENQAKNMQQVKPIRSNSTKSLAKSKYQSCDRNPPFSTTIKNALFQTQRKFSTNQTPAYSSRQKQPSNNLGKGGEDIQCKHLIEGERIVGYSWFHQSGKGISSVSKRSKDQKLRYFAIKQAIQGQQKKKIIAAIEDDIIYVGSKKYILVSSNTNKLITKEETQKLKLGESSFMLIVHESVASFANLHKFVALVYELIADGVKSIDAVTNIMGRKLLQLSKNSNKEKKEEMFILLILTEKKLKKITKITEQ